jgi:ATP:ADP antiporter, AAA family
MTDENQKTERAGFLKILGDVRAGETAPVLLMLLNLTIILISYYIIKVVREPLILASPGGAAWKSYSAAAQAVVLMGFIPLYGWFSSKVDRMKLVLGVNVFFLICIEIFSVLVKADVPYIGVAFFIWVGIFSLSIIAQFWSLANDIYREDQGKRLFPIIAIGATLGSPIGSKLASLLFKKGIPALGIAKLQAPSILHISAALLAVSMVLYWILQKKYIHRIGDKTDQVKQKLTTTSGFTLLFRSRYLLLIAALLLLLNVVNTTGEFILGDKVVAAADQAVLANPEVEKEAFIGGFYGDFFFIVNIVTFIVQAFLVSRIVKYFGIAGVVLWLPFIALGAYTTIALGAGIALIRWMKIAENSSDYSVMNTARAMLWLPTNREEKYKGKQTVDTFIVRIGDLLSAGIVFVGLNWLQLESTGFALVNIVAIAIWLFVGFLVVKHYRSLIGRERTGEPRTVTA